MTTKEDFIDFFKNSFSSTNDYDELFVKLIMDGYCSSNNFSHSVITFDTSDKLKTAIGELFNTNDDKSDDIINIALNGVYVEASFNDNNLEFKIIDVRCCETSSFFGVFKSNKYNVGFLMGSFYIDCRAHKLKQNYNVMVKFFKK